jgi:hypothetical protein
MCAISQLFDYVTAVRSIWSSIRRILTNPDRNDGIGAGFRQTAVSLGRHRAIASRSVDRAAIQRE